MFNPKEIFPIVRASMTKGSDQQVMGALDQLAKAHPELSNEQALAALQAFVKQQGGGAAPAAAPGAKPGSLSAYLGGNK